MQDAHQLAVGKVGGMVSQVGQQNILAPEQISGDLCEYFGIT